MPSSIIIYGATGAVGSATARQLSREGYPLHLVGRNREKLSALGEELGSETTTGDVTDPDLFDRVAARTDQPVQGLVYAVGTLTLGSIRRLSPKDYLADFLTNAMGAALAVRAALPRLKKHPGTGSILLFSSVAVQRGFTLHASMGMAKGAVEGLTRSLAAELAPKIRVNAIAPSLTRTPLAGKILASPEMAAALEKQHALKRLGTPEDLAQTAAFLVSEQSGWITGQILGVDGGRSALDTRA